MQQMLKQAQKMQQQIAKAQAELAEAELTGTAGGGLVTATVAGTGELKSIKIDPKAVDPDDVETLEDLVVADLPIPGIVTVYTRWGAWVPAGCVLALLAAALVGRSRRR